MKLVTVLENVEDEKRDNKLIARSERDFRTQNHQRRDGIGYGGF